MATKENEKVEETVELTPEQIEQVSGGGDIEDYKEKIEEMNIPRVCEICGKKFEGASASQLLAHHVLSHILGE